MGSFANATNPFTNTTDNSGSGTAFSGMGFDFPDSVAYTTTTDSQMTAGDTGNIRSSMQDTLQGAYATNTTNMTNSMDITGMDGSDLVNNMTLNTNAMNSNAGSSYNDSTNNITTNTENNSTNDYTSTLDSSRNFTQPSRNVTQPARPVAVYS